MVRSGYQWIPPLLSHQIPSSLSLCYQQRGEEKVLDGLLAALSCFIVRVVFPKRATSLWEGN
jgi:hypothetical protein